MKAKTKEQYLEKQRRRAANGHKKKGGRPQPPVPEVSVRTGDGPRMSFQTMGILLTERIRHPRRIRLHQRKQIARSIGSQQLEREIAAIFSGGKK